MLSRVTNIIFIYCEIISFHGHEISWFDNDGHVRGILMNSWISNYINITKVNTYFVGILNSWIALPTKNMKNVQQIEMIS